MSWNQIPTDDKGQLTVVDLGASTVRGAEGKSQCSTSSSHQIEVVATIRAQFILRTMKLHEVILINLTKCFHSFDDHCQAVSKKRLTR